MVEPTSPDSASSEGGSPSATGNRNRSVSMNMHSNAPPSKKQRASDDEYEQATPPPAPAQGPTSPYSAADAVDAASAISEARDQVSDETVAPDVEEDQLDGSGSAVPTPVPPFGDDGDSSSDESDVNEEAFMNWLVDQKSAGMPAGQMLDALGLGVSDGVAVDDDELWEAIALASTTFQTRNAYIEFFRSNPKPFFAFAKELFPKSSGFTFVPSPSHYFLKLLEEKGKLLRIYSQNIDMLEHAAGISHEHAVLCHGSFATATSSDDEGSSSSSEEGTGEEGTIDADAVVVAMDSDDEKKAPPNDDLPKDDQDELMGSGNELLGASSFDDN
ncbi:hypothetical protein JG687_00005764 [Phytophthora cactorum]|uniref:Deacetylase sirtuin-type domain-containing protein n=1 Tax=Phytophthora cactorum TaxID=29920 RepID=A0A8T1UPQ6_9STRA|nr:hypothetical protein JG687_00005764 [Phytophthora cactorum]